MTRRHLSVVPDPDPDPLIRPSLDASIAALRAKDRRYPHVIPTEDDLDAAELLQFISDTHQGARDCDNPDEPGHFYRTWGTCRGCGEVWPCSKWAEGHNLAVEFIGRVHNRYADHAKQAINLLRAAEKKPEKPA